MENRFILCFSPRTVQTVEDIVLHLEIDLEFFIQRFSIVSRKSDGKLRNW